MNFRAELNKGTSWKWTEYVCCIVNCTQIPFLDRTWLEFFGFSEKCLLIENNFLWLFLLFFDILCLFWVVFLWLESYKIVNLLLLGVLKGENRTIFKEFGKKSLKSYMPLTPDPNLHHYSQLNRQLLPENSHSIDKMWQFFKEIIFVIWYSRNLFAKYLEDSR